MSEWIKCADKMPDCDELREKPHKAFFWIHVGFDGGYVSKAYRVFQNEEWLWVSQLRTDRQLIFADIVITHYMPIIEPAPPQD